MTCYLQKYIKAFMQYRQSIVKFQREEQSLPVYTGQVVDAKGSCKNRNLRINVYKGKGILDKGTAA